FVNPDMARIKSVLHADTPVGVDHPELVADLQIAIEKIWRNVPGQGRRIDIAEKNENDPLRLLHRINLDPMSADLRALGIRQDRDELTGFPRIGPAVIPTGDRPFQKAFRPA